MRLSALICSRYRNIKDRQYIKLAPITLIIGKNGSGKSVISRLPLLLSSAISDTTEGPLDLYACGIEHATSFKDLVHARGAMPFSLGAEFSNDESTYSFETTLRYIEEKKSLAIELFTLIKDDNAIFTAEILNAEQLELDNPTFKTSTADSSEENISLSFSGLLPKTDSLDDDTKILLDNIFDNFRKALPKPSYLGPFRVEPKSFMRVPNQNISTLGPKGERALEMLADDKLRHGGKLTANVSEWFRTNMGHEISIDTSNDQPRVYLTDARTQIEVSLNDTGAGFSQSIPIVVQHLSYRNGRIPSSMLIVEQPELHLHPAAHGDLADLIVDSARGKECPPATCIVETHSEQFIMRIRRRIAEGFPAENVKIWSLNHINDGEQDTEEPENSFENPLHIINFDQAGNPDSWPAGVFEEALKDLAIMRRNARDRGL